MMQMQRAGQGRGRGEPRFTSLRRWAGVLTQSSEVRRRPSPGPGSMAGARHVMVRRIRDRRQASCRPGSLGPQQQRAAANGDAPKNGWLGKGWELSTAWARAAWMHSAENAKCRVFTTCRRHNACEEAAQLPIAKFHAINNRPTRLAGARRAAAARTPLAAQLHSSIAPRELQLQSSQLQLRRGSSRQPCGAPLPLQARCAAAIATHREASATPSPGQQPCPVPLRVAHVPRCRATGAGVSWAARRLSAQRHRQNRGSSGCLVRASARCKQC